MLTLSAHGRRRLVDCGSGCCGAVISRLFVLPFVADNEGKADVVQIPLEIWCGQRKSLRRMLHILHSHRLAALGTKGAVFGNAKRKCMVKSHAEPFVKRSNCNIRNLC